MSLDQHENDLNTQKASSFRLFLIKEPEPEFHWLMKPSSCRVAHTKKRRAIYCLISNCSRLSLRLAFFGVIGRARVCVSPSSQIAEKENRPRRGSRRTSLTQKCHLRADKSMANNFTQLFFTSIRVEHEPTTPPGADTSHWKVDNPDIPGCC